jgi:hypothetical protein
MKKITRKLIKILGILSILTSPTLHAEADPFRDYKRPNNAFYENIFNQYPAVPKYEGKNTGIKVTPEITLNIRQIPDGTDFSYLRQRLIKESMQAPNLNNNYRIASDDFPFLLINLQNKNAQVLEGNNDPSLSNLDFGFEWIGADAPMIFFRSSPSSRIVIIERAEYYIGPKCPQNGAYYDIVRYGYELNSMNSMQTFKVAFKTPVKSCVAYKK